MTRVYGKLFSDDRDGFLVIKPSRPFFGVGRDERHYEVKSGEIDLNLDPTPAGVHYQIGFKQPGDIRRTDFTLKWQIPARESYDVTPGADNTLKKEASRPVAASVYERVQLKRVAVELTESLDTNDELEAKLDSAERRVHQLEDELRAYKRTADAVLSDRDEVIAQLQEQNVPTVKTVYLDKPVPPAALNERIKRLERENQRLIDLNAQYYKSVVELHQLQLDKARNSPQAPPVEANSSPQKRLLRKLLGK